MSAAELAAVTDALRRGHLARARLLLDRVTGEDPVATHLDAILLWREGRIETARARFAAALRARPRSADWLADVADFEASQGRIEPAMALFRQSIAADPAAALPRRLRLGLALFAGNRLTEARAELDALVRDAPGSALAWQALGAVRRAAGDVAGAATAFDRVLAINPADPLARLSRAYVDADRGRPAAAAFAQALAADPGSGPARTGLAAAQAPQSFAAAEATLRARLTVDPAWTEGWAALASLAHQWQGRAAFIAVVAEALLSARGAEQALAAMALLARAGEHRGVLDHLPLLRDRWGDSSAALLIEAVACDELGNLVTAARLFDRLGDGPEPALAFARLRHQLRAGLPERAAASAERLVEGENAAMAWAYLGTAWRMLGDARHDWLEGDPRLVGRYDLGLSPGDLAQLADRLRHLHQAIDHPFEQSMRGGTQSEGVLLSREEPEIQRLRHALSDAVHDHLRQLPPIDPRHPTLREPRKASRFAGSWSVRLTGSGHHVSHVHGDGWFSSACHVIVPSGVDGGLLTLGEPPAELATGLAPTRTIKPEPGWLVLFPSTMWHGTTPFDTGERLTVAFDVQPMR